MFKKLLIGIGTVFTTGKDNDGGLIGLIKEKTGKISFKRSFAIVVLTLVVVPDVSANGLTWKNIVVLGIAAGIYAIPKLFNKESS